MSAFTDSLTITEHNVDTDEWSLVTPLIWEVDAIGSRRFITAVAGFTSDGASIPWPLSMIFPRWGRKYHRPAVLHDYLYSLLRAGKPHAFAPTRVKADHVFREAMFACGVSLPIRWLFWAAVRSFGWLVLR